MFPLRIEDDAQHIELRPLSDQDALAMFTLIENNRAHLDAWLRWSGRIHTLEDVQALITRFAAKYADGDGFHAGLYVDGQLVGGLVCHFINRESNKTEIGYWLSTDYVGHGLITRACRQVIGYLFEHEQMHRIEIQCVVENKPSRAVAERLGFTLEGIKRESDWITSAYRDHCMYSLLAREWAG
jgi:ribosomal-protein-serine acetyltransferase